MKLLDEARVEESVKDHCRLVAVIACRLVRLLNNAGAGLDEELVRAAALLHDIRRHEKDHARAGAMFIKTCGYSRVADIVAAHMDTESVAVEFPTETEIVYVADKLVMGRRCVPLEERFAVALERHRGDAKIIPSILHRKEQAERIKKKVERSIGCTLEETPLTTWTDPVKENPREA
jgi:molybdenum cofactor cytidylyltransferase